MAYQTVNPFNNEVLQSFADISDAQLDAKLAAASACFETWRHASYADRAKVVMRASVLLHEQAEAFAQIMTKEMGKRISEARGEVEFSAQILAYYAENAERFLAPVTLHPKAGEAHMESSPIGVIFGVEPWNFPYYQLARVAGPHLMAGNTLVIKHAGCVPRCAIAFERLFVDAGAPAWAVHQPADLARPVRCRHRRRPDQGRGADRQHRGRPQHRRPRRAQPEAVVHGARAAATPSSCSRTPTSTTPSNGRSGAGCTMTGRPAAPPSGSSSSRPSPTSS